MTINDDDARVVLCLPIFMLFVGWRLSRQKFSDNSLTISDTPAHVKWQAHSYHAWLIDWDLTTLSTNTLYRAFEKYVAVKTKQWN